jgi:hypothetical protein
MNLRFTPSISCSSIEGYPEPPKASEFIDNE